MAAAIDIGPDARENESGDYAYYAQGRQTRGIHGRK
jgi:hypothetical protein